MPEYDPLEIPLSAYTTSESDDVDESPAAESEDASHEEAQTEETEQSSDDTVADEGETPDTEAQSDGDVLEMDEDLRELGFPDLAPELAADPGTHRRWIETQRGVKNMVDTIKPYYEYVKALNDPSRQSAAFEELFKVTGYRPTGQPQEPTSPDTIDTDESQFEYEGEQRAYERAKREAIAEMEQKYGDLLSQLSEQQKQTVADRAFNAKVDKEAPAVIGYFGKAEGFSVTKEMVAEAMRKHPDTDVIQAVKMAHIDAYVAHKAGKPVKRGPEMVSGGGSKAKGMALPNVAPEDYDTLTADQIRSVIELMPD